jgi:hypothetical protein
LLGHERALRRRSAAERQMASNKDESSDTSHRAIEHRTSYDVMRIMIRT